MSIINNANPGSSILIISTIDQYLGSVQKNISLETLKQHLRPDTLPKSTNAEKRFEENLNFWLTHSNLWTIEEEMIFLETKDKNVPLEFRLLQKIIENTPDKKHFMDGTNVEPFALYITCLLEQDRYSFAGRERLVSGVDTNIPQAIHQYAKLSRVPNQSNESNHLIRWATFLGFMEPDENKNYMVDPTRAILPYLKQIFAEQSTFSIQEFLQKLGESLPMFGNGRFVQYLSEVIHEPRQSQYQISAALSHALLRFEAMNKIVLDKKSDDINVMQLYMPQGMPRRVISAISFRDSV